MEQILNFRPVAKGMENNQGKQITNLYRSADVTSASPSDIEQLLTLGIKDIIDLRTAEERVNLLQCDELNIHNINIIANNNQNLVDIFGIAKLTEIMINLYQTEFIESDGFSNVLKYILSLEGKPVLFHCTAGKDRTGITAVILMHLLGFSYEDIKNEYLNIDELLVKILLNKILDQLKDEEVLHIDSIRAVVTVSEAFLEAFLLGITDEYGTFDQYIKCKLDVNDQDIEQLKAWYLV